MGISFYCRLIDIYRSRIPVPMHQVPTDTDVAMELISQRVARGLPVLPSKMKQRSPNPDIAAQDEDRPEGERRGSDDKAKDVDWKKWGGMVASGKTWASGKKQVPSSMTVSAALFKRFLDPNVCSRYTGSKLSWTSRNA